jgi:hypothetical protein
MLSWAGSGVPSLPAGMPGSRRARVERQGTLWPAERPTSAARRFWEGLDEPGRSRVLAALARLIGKAVAREGTTPNTEDGHER